MLTGVKKNNVYMYTAVKIGYLLGGSGLLLFNGVSFPESKLIFVSDLVLFFSKEYS